MFVGQTNMGQQRRPKHEKRKSLRKNFVTNTMHCMPRRITGSKLGMSSFEWAFAFLTTVHVDLITLGAHRHPYI